MTPELQKPALPLKRGMIYAATLNAEVGEKYWLVISNHLRNKNIGDVLAVRLTTTRNLRGLRGLSFPQVSRCPVGCTVMTPQLSVTTTR